MEAGYGRSGKWLVRGYRVGIKADFKNSLLNYSSHRTRVNSIIDKRNIYKSATQKLYCSVNFIILKRAFMIDHNC